jgi:hypothetical protein
MSEASLELLGRLVEQLLDGQRRIEARLERIESTMATKGDLVRLWRVAEGKLELSREELLAGDAALAERLERLEERVAMLEAQA